MANSSNIPCIAADIQTPQSAPPNKKERERPGVWEREKQDYYRICLLLRPFIAENGGWDEGGSTGEIYGGCERVKEKEGVKIHSAECRTDADMKGSKVWWGRTVGDTLIHKAKPSLLLLSSSHLGKNSDKQASTCSRGHIWKTWWSLEGN